MTKKLLFFSLIALLVGCSSSSDFEKMREARAARLEKADIRPGSFTVNDSFILHYQEGGTQGKPLVVLIHGTPGDWQSLAELMLNQELSASAHLIAIDRPGWGKSLLDGRRSEPDFNAQSQLLVPFLRHLKASRQQPLILAGHSWGGTLAPYIARHNDGLVDALLLAASDIDPEYGKPRWFNYAARIWPVSRLIDRQLQLANDEMFGVKPAVQSMHGWWQTSTTPVIFVQGTEDELVDSGNLEYALQHFPEDTGHVVALPGEGHFLHVQQQPLLAELTLTLIKAVENRLQLGDMQSCEPSLPVC